MLAMNANDLVENAPVDAAIGMVRLSPAHIDKQLVHISHIAHRAQTHPQFHVAGGSEAGVEEADLVEGCLADHTQRGHGAGQSSKHFLKPGPACADLRVAAHKIALWQRIHPMVAALPAGMREYDARVAAHHVRQPFDEMRQVPVVIVADLDVVSTGDLNGAVDCAAHSTLDLGFVIPYSRIMPGEAPDIGFGTVGRMIVGPDQLQIAPGLAQYHLYAFAKMIQPIVSNHDDTNCWHVNHYSLCPLRNRTSGSGMINVPPFARNACSSATISAS